MPVLQAYTDSMHLTCEPCKWKEARTVMNGYCWKKSKKELLVVLKCEAHHYILGKPIQRGRECVSQIQRW